MSKKSSEKAKQFTVVSRKHMHRASLGAEIVPREKFQGERPQNLLKC
jgi:hypothetical protein